MEIDIKKLDPMQYYTDALDSANQYLASLGKQKQDALKASAIEEARVSGFALGWATGRGDTQSMKEKIIADTRSKAEQDRLSIDKDFATKEQAGLQSKQQLLTETGNFVYGVQNPAKSASGWWGYSPYSSKDKGGCVQQLDPNWSGRQVLVCTDANWVVTIKDPLKEEDSTKKKNYMWSRLTAWWATADLIGRWLQKIKFWPAKLVWSVLRYGWDIVVGAWGIASAAQWNRWQATASAGTLAWLLWGKKILGKISTLFK